MAVKEHISAEDMLASLIPFEEIDPEKPVKTIYTSASDFTENETIAEDDTQELSRLEKTKLDVIHLGVDPQLG